MIALLICVLAFASAYFVTRKSVVAGLIAVLATGYMYGITRAQFPTAFSHFIFDASVAGFYLCQPWKARPEGRTKALRTWTSMLIGWPFVILLLPFQTIMISLVGLRGNVMVLPALLIGSRLRNVDLIKIGTAVAVLNLIACGFGSAEYVWGVQRFYPESAATRLIYQSNDVAGYQYLRIPATFTNAHVYGGTMVFSLPFLFGMFVSRGASKWQKLTALAGVGAAMFGILFSATRTNFVIAAVLVTFMLAVSKTPLRFKVLIVLGVLAILIPALDNERFNRFKTLQASGAVTDRIAGSVNRSFWEVLISYPMGNGLGGGGTSIPYFLESELNRPVTIESEYGRILLEQGIIGLVMWIGFVGWFLSRRSVAFSTSSWQIGRQLGWILCLIAFGGAMIGVGMLIAIPQSLMFPVLVGWVTCRQLEPEVAPPTPGAYPEAWPALSYYR